MAKADHESPACRLASKEQQARVTGAPKESNTNLSPQGEAPDLIRGYDADGQVQALTEGNARHILWRVRP
jgi:hypothetical protein